MIYSIYFSDHIVIPYYIVCFSDMHGTLQEEFCQQKFVLTFNPCKLRLFTVLRCFTLMLFGYQISIINMFSVYSG